MYYFGAARRWMSLVSPDLFPSSVRKGFGNLKRLCSEMPDFPWNILNSRIHSCVDFCIFLSIILGEINCRECRTSKTAVLTILKAMYFDFNEFVQCYRAGIIFKWNSFGIGRKNFVKSLYIQRNKMNFWRAGKISWNYFRYILTFQTKHTFWT